MPSIPTAFVNPPYDAVKDFTPISSVCVNPLVLYAIPSLPPTMMDLVELMKKNPGKYSYGSAGTGSIIHLAVEYLKRAVGGMDVVHVPYKGGAPAIQDTIAGNIACSMETFSTTLPLHRAGKLRILAFLPFQARADCTGDPDHDRGGCAGLRGLYVQPRPGSGGPAAGP